ncbi:MAG: helix-loop-helix domain-containing protein [Bacteroidetes bacterium]|nr:helix-loop-helix domain-containing protein [Bacteroidota bacterium]
MFIIFCLRAVHNELEKNRRANLRNYLDTLKTILPVDPDSTRDTTLSLLTRARNYIQVCVNSNFLKVEGTRICSIQTAHARLVSWKIQIVNFW